MSQSKFLLPLTGLAVIGLGAGLLVWLGAQQQLGRPGVKTSPIATNSHSLKVKVELPASLPGWTTEEIEPDELTLKALPKDTSFGQRRYTAPDQFWANLNVVLMGTDRTSIHKPEFCLTGSGWTIEKQEADRIRIGGRAPFDLPVMKFTASRVMQSGGQAVTLRGIYVFWFVADGQLTASHRERMWWMARDLLRRGVLERWAYVTCLAVCSPGQEAATYERMKGLIIQSVPEFQLTAPAP